MFRNYFITAWRNILKNRTFSLINVLGLALGMAGATESWLEEFVYKIPLSWWMFTLPVILMVLISLLTVSQHMRRAAKLNPVKLLRYE